MKKLLFIVTLVALMMAVNLHASDITVNETRPTVTLWKLDTVRFLLFTSTCEVTYRKGYMDGDDFVSTGALREIIFQNVTDNPATPEDETCTDFTDLITAINNGSNIKTTITNAVKIKLGI